MNYVSWASAARFANWLHNGQPTGAQDRHTTEDGAYFLNVTSDPAINRVTREPGWKGAIPTEDEWYKAAYHKNDGATANYFFYPTSSDSMPSNGLASPDPGNNATFYDGGYTIDSPYYRTEAGSHEHSYSPYGTFDQGGNVAEWNEAILDVLHRDIRGGTFSHEDDFAALLAVTRRRNFPTYPSNQVGFRVVQVPEPATLALLALGGLGVLLRWRRN